MGTRPRGKAPGRAAGRLFTVLLALAAAGPSQAVDGAPGCVGCHPAARSGAWDPAHDFGPSGCPVCHGGDASAATRKGAHRGLIAFPGNLDNAERTCGRCHPREVRGVREGPMHRGRGMVAATRRVLGDCLGPGGEPGDLQTLDHGPADSLLRKRCAGCHLGQPKAAHAMDVVHDRGGGCLACHVQANPGNTHPGLTARVEDGRCFGCHSRSGRISLSYVGLAEVDEAALSGPGAERLLRLADGRLLERREPDLHHRAGMGCIDCHTARDTMGLGPATGDDGPCDAVDITCLDCHAARLRGIDPTGWPAGFEALRRRIPFALEAGTRVPVTTCGTPLWNVQLDGSRRLLYPKRGGAPLPIPALRPRPGHEPEGQHGRLTCDACHARWAPRCHGCHLRYDPEGRQWDHLEGRVTSGRWLERRWGIDNGPPALGVTGEGRIATFVPGMILTVEHPAWEVPRFRRLYARLSPHTTGRARGCPSCHHDAYALGLGEGDLIQTPRGWRLDPEKDPGPDGLPADAWTSLEARVPAPSPHPGDRSFTREELLRILAVEYPAASDPAASP